MFPVRTVGQPILPAHQLETGEVDWHVPEEVPVAFTYSRRNYAVMMATPSDLLDFAVGFSLSEEIARSIDDIQSLEIDQREVGIDLRFHLDATALLRMDTTLRRRNLVGTASCGLCGLDNADVLFKRLPKVRETPVELAESAIVQAMSDLAEHQILNRQTRSVHAAAWVTPEGIIKLVREDVGRHNAVDKLLGALALGRVSTDDGFLLVSSRCSYEIIEKAARCGVSSVASISGPTALALRKASEAGMSIYCRSKAGVSRLH